MPDYSITFKNKTFAHEKVELDGKQFDNCDFRECLVILEKGETRLLPAAALIIAGLLLRGNAYMGRADSLAVCARPSPEGCRV